MTMSYVPQSAKAHYTVTEVKTVPTVDVENCIQAYTEYKKAKAIKEVQEKLNHERILKELATPKSDGQKAQAKTDKKVITVALKDNTPKANKPQKDTPTCSDVTGYINIHINNKYVKDTKTTTQKVKLTDNSDSDNIYELVEYKAPSQNDTPVKKYTWIKTDEQKMGAIWDATEQSIYNHDMDSYLTAVYDILPYSVGRYLLKKEFFKANSKELIPNTDAHDEFKCIVYENAVKVIRQWDSDGVNDKSIYTYDAKDVYNLLKAYVSYECMNTYSKLYTVHKYDNLYVNDLSINDYQYINGAVFDSHIDGISDLYDRLEIDYLMDNLNHDITPKQKEYIALLTVYGAKAIAQGKTSDGKKVKRIKGDNVKEIKELCSWITMSGRLTDKQITILTDRLYKRV